GVGVPAGISWHCAEQRCNMARGCLCCLKYLMFLFNLIFWVSAVYAAVGSWEWASGSRCLRAASPPSRLPSRALRCQHGHRHRRHVMVTGFLGCLGSIKENKCLLLSFFIVLLIILLAELILLILFFVYSDKVRENAKQDLKDGLALYNTDNNVGLRNAWNIIQAEWKCCGVTAYSDWHDVEANSPSALEERLHLHSPRGRFSFESSLPSSPLLAVFVFIYIYWHANITYTLYIYYIYIIYIYTF
uniref:Tetraspanin 9a n=2 Tax=Gadus morhua TaxID=8049 RepID=A0A8C5BS34_GADMO